MFENLKEVEQRFEDIQVKLSDPATFTDNELFTKLMKENKQLTPIVEKYREYCAAIQAEADGKEMLQEGDVDADLKEMLQEEIETAKKNLGDALLEKGLVTEDEHKSGFYTYIDGIRADYNKDGAWWCFTKGGESVMVGANELEIANGDTFEITNTPA